MATFADKTGPYRVTRYNLYPAVELDGDTAPGYSTGQSIETMEKLASGLPQGFATEWTDIAFQHAHVQAVVAQLRKLGRAGTGDVEPGARPAGRRANDADVGHPRTGSRDDGRHISGCAGGDGVAVDVE